MDGSALGVTSTPWRFHHQTSSCQVLRSEGGVLAPEVQQYFAKMLGDFGILLSFYRFCSPFLPLRILMDAWCVRQSRNTYNSLVPYQRAVGQHCRLRQLWTEQTFKVSCPEMMKRHKVKDRSRKGGWLSPALQTFPPSPVGMIWASPHWAWHPHWASHLHWAWRQLRHPSQVPNPWWSADGQVHCPGDAGQQTLTEGTWIV